MEWPRGEFQNAMLTFASEAFYSSAASSDVLIKINRDHVGTRRGEGGRPADLGRRARFGTEMVKE